MVTSIQKAALTALALLGYPLLGLGAPDVAFATALPLAPHHPISQPPPGVTAHGPAATLRSAITRAGRVDVALRCHRSGTVGLVGPDGRRGPTSHFHCRSGSARVQLRRRVSLAASIAIVAGSGELRMPLARTRDRKARSRSGNVRARASAYDPTVFTSCYGRMPSQGGGGAVAFNVQQYSNFGQPYYSLVEWRPWVHWVQRSTGQSGYYTDQPRQKYVSYPNAFGAGGSYVDTTPGHTVWNEGGTSFPGKSNTIPVTLNYSGLNALPFIETWINGVHESAWFPTTTVNGSSGWYRGWCLFN